MTDVQIAKDFIDAHTEPGKRFLFEDSYFYARGKWESKYGCPSQKDVDKRLLEAIIRYMDSRAERANPENAETLRSVITARRVAIAVKALI